MRAGVLPMPAPSSRRSLDDAGILSGHLRQELDKDAELRRGLDMGVILQRQAPSVADGRRVAAALLRQALSLGQAGKLVESIALLQKAIAADPTNPSAHYDLGLTLAKCQRHYEAAGHLHRATTLKPTYAEAHYALGIALQNLGRDASAMEALRRAVELAPRLADAHNRLGHLLRAAERHTEAQECFRRAAAGARNTTLGRICEATFLLGEGKFVEAAEVLRRALARDRNNFMANTVLAHVLGFLGELDAAIAQYRRALTLADDPVIPWQGLVQFKKVVEADRPLIAQIFAYLQQKNVGTTYRMQLHFTLGKAFDDLQEYDAAISHYEEANRIRRSLGSFERDRIVQEVNSAITCGTPGFFAERSALGVEDETPVFVIGMPRSGTTLVEQVLSNHLEIAGAGELPFWREQSVAWGETGAAAIDAAAARRLAGEYLAVLRRASATAARVVDKMPFNFLWISYIRTAFPLARFIHCRRHPIDTCLSIFFTPFTTIQGFAADRDDLVFYYKEYLRPWSIGGGCCRPRFLRSITRG